MAEEVFWLETIKDAMKNLSTHGVTISSGAIKGPNGEKLIQLTFTDPIRGGSFNVDIPDDAELDEVKRRVRNGWRQFTRHHPVTRGAAT